MRRIALILGVVSVLTLGACGAPRVRGIVRPVDPPSRCCDAACSYRSAMTCGVDVPNVAL